MEWNVSWWKYKYSRNWRIQASFIISRGKVIISEYYPLQPLSSSPWRKVTAFSKCLVFSADKERLVGSLWELFAMLLLWNIRKDVVQHFGFSNETAEQGAVSLLPCFYLQIDRYPKLFSLCLQCKWQSWSMRSFLLPLPCLVFFFFLEASLAIKRLL